MKKLGEMLVERGWLSRSDLHRALNNQRMMGGRLGTCLLEADMVPEDRLMRALADQHGVEPAAVDDLRRVPQETLALVPKKVAVRCLAVPLHATSSKLDLAMIDPRDLACQDEIGFVSSRRLVIHVASEARLREALERHYEERLDNRMSRLLDQLNRRRYLWQDERDEGGGAKEPLEARDLFPAAPELKPPSLPRPSFLESAGVAAAAERAAGATPQAVEAPAVGRTAIPRSGSLPLTRKERAALYGGALGGPLSFADAEKLLGELTDRDEVGDVLVSFLRQELDRVLLFGVRRNTVVGWAGDGEGLDERRISGYRLALDKPSIFLNLRQGSAFHLGPLPHMPAHRGLIDLLGGEAPEECLLLPLRLGDHMVAVIYGDRNGEHVAGVDLEALRHLGDVASDALERCILLKRQAQPGSKTG